MGRVRPHSQHRKPRRAKPGTAPGLLHVDPEAPIPELSVMAYSPTGFEEKKAVSLEEIASLRGRFPVLWVNVDGLGDLAVLEGLQRQFALHHLAMEDVVHVHQRPKADVYEDHLYLVMRMFQLGHEPQDEQLSLFLGHDFVITFQERPGDCLDPVRERVRIGRPRMRQGGADYLAYAIIDAVVDHLFPVLEEYGDELEALEERVFTSSSDETALALQRIKHDLILLRRASWPLREAVGQLQRENSALFTPETRIYLRDVYDHIVQFLDLVESHREIAGGLKDMLLSSISNRMNEIMKVLTIIGTIFIPLGFVAGLYGMNFDTQASRWNMPELGFAFGYPLALTMMAAIAGGLLFYFYRKGWLGKGKGLL